MGSWGCDIEERAGIPASSPLPLISWARDELFVMLSNSHPGLRTDHKTPRAWSLHGLGKIVSQSKHFLFIC